MKQSIIQILTDLGPLTMREIADQLGQDIDTIRQSIGSLRNRTPGIIHIHSYRRDTDGGRLYPRALWAVGNKADAKRPPKLCRSEYNRRARVKRKSFLPSIFHIGLVNESLSARLQLNKTFTLPAPPESPCAAHTATESKPPSSTQNAKSEAQQSFADACV